MRVVVLAGSLPASAEPSRIEKNGIAMMIITAAATTANTAGRCCIQPLQRAHAGGLVGRAQPAVAQRAPLPPAQHEAPEEAEQRRQQRQRREHRERDRDRRGDRDAVQEADAEREHPEHRDADDHAREQHGAAGGVERLDDRVLAGSGRAARPAGSG